MQTVSTRVMGAKPMATVSVLIIYFILAMPPVLMHALNARSALALASIASLCFDHCFEARALLV
jgi:hypothetical protein